MTAAAVVLIALSVIIVAMIVAKRVHLPLSVEIGMAMVAVSALGVGVHLLEGQAPTWPTIFLCIFGALLCNAGFKRRRRQSTTFDKLPPNEDC